MKKRYFANKIIGKNKKEGAYIAIYNLYAGNIYPWNNIFYFSRRRLALFIIFAYLKFIRACEIANKWKNLYIFPIISFPGDEKNNIGALPPSTQAHYPSFFIFR